ncbi:MAG TPA: hypothetical protein VNF68_11575, partial [Candidatus Baltobacteraceae bacterium]|nr:hypothetical protein [Candidatus Baltobacteraceae bacterium]
HGMMNPMSDVALVARIRARRIAFPQLRTNGAAIVLLQTYFGPTATFITVSYGKSTWRIPTYAPRSKARFRWISLRALPSAQDVLSVTNDARGDAAIAQVAVLTTRDYGIARARLTAALDRTALSYRLDGDDRQLWVPQGGTYELQALCLRQPAAVTVGPATSALAKRGSWYGAAIQMPPGNAKLDLRALNFAGCREIVLSRGEPARDRTNGQDLARLSGTTYVAGKTPAKSTVLLDTGFSPVWRINDPGAVHFLANGYANGWLVSAARDHIRVTNVAKALLLAGEIVSALFVLTALSFFFVESNRHRASR